MENCSHPSGKLTKINNSEGCVFCQNCGLILYPTKTKKFIKTIKPTENQSKTEIDPIDLFLNAYKQTPFIQMQDDSIYPEKRSRAIKILEKFNNLYHYSDEVFFLALSYMDNIFKSIYNAKNKEISKKKEELYILNCLLIAEKFFDKDVNIIPDYSLYIKSTIYNVDVDDIRENEINCLKTLKYKLDHHSLYDILKGFMYNGFIFENEIDFNSIGHQIKFAYNYAEKLFRDIIYSYISIYYPPYLVAFIIIYLTRKKFFEHKYMKKIKSIYGIKQNDYKECYEDIKSFLIRVEKGLKVSDYNKMNKDKILKKDEKNEVKENNDKIEEIKNEEKHAYDKNSGNQTASIKQINNMINVNLDDKNKDKKESPKK